MSDAATKVKPGLFLRIAVCFLSLGFIFPHALMESTDAAKLAAKELAEATEESRKAAK
jgi:hypothetical protein